MPKNDAAQKSPHILDNRLETKHKGVRAIRGSPETFSKIVIFCLHRTYPLEYYQMCQ